METQEALHCQRKKLNVECHESRIIRHQAFSHLLPICRSTVESNFHNHGSILHDHDQGRHDCHLVAVKIDTKYVSISDF